MPKVTQTLHPFLMELANLWEGRANLLQRHTHLWRGYVIRPIQFADVEEVSQFSMRREFGATPYRTYEQVHQNVVDSYRDFQQYNSGFFVAHKNDQLVGISSIGMDSAFGVGDIKKPELGFARIAKEHQGKGLGLKMQEMILTKAFGKMPDIVVVAHVATNNEASKGVIRRLGFQEGVTSSFTLQDLPTFSQGVGEIPLTMTTFSLTKEQFDQRPQTNGKAPETASKP